VTPLRVAVDVRCLAHELRGHERYTLELARALSRLPSADVVGVTDSAPRHDLPVPVERFAGRSEVVREQLALPRLLRRLRADVLLAPANRGLPLVSPCPGVLTLHDAVEWDRALVERPTGRSRARFAYASAVSLAAAAEIVTVSAFSAEQIEQTLGVPRHELHVVPEAASDRFAPAGDDDGRVLRRLGLAPGYVLYVGGFDAKKDVPTLVRAHARLGELAPPLVLAGTGDAPTGERVRAIGFVPEEDLPALYRGASCFAFPALSEGFGLPVLEAMACGTPTVCADAGALPETAGDAALFFPPGDADALASALQRLQAEGPAWSARALAHAARFTWERTATETLAVLEQARRRFPRRLGAAARAART
jgi:glycosyltransferase involved in cell wall biosynthesis